MKQVVQALSSRKLAVTEVPSPTLRPQGILVRTGASLVSVGTERMIVEFAQKGLLEKARARPDQVRQVLDKVAREGLLNTIDAVRNRLSQVLPLGYSSAGVVVGVGAEAVAFQVGDRVACAGGGYATHAEMAYVPRTLAVKLPPAVSYEAGAFATLGAIAMQGVRQAEAAVGDRVAVIGLGLVGQITVQILKAAGCQILGVDLDARRVALAQSLGADIAATNDGAVAAGERLTGGLGVDAVLLTADTPSSDPIALAGELARDRAKVVAVGAVGLEVPRKAFYYKELDLRLSRSYGPGRYDPEYEEKGRDYPFGYVRWTEQRNMQSFVQLVASGSVRVEPLVTHRFSIDQAEAAYDLITGRADEPFLGVVITYDTERPLPDRIVLRTGTDGAPRATASSTAMRIGMLGAGSFATGALLPIMRRLPGLELVGIVSGSGTSARASGERFGFDYCASDASALLADERINWLVVTTRHDLHAAQAIAGMEAGKNVYVEKPLALTREELRAVLGVQRRTGRVLMVGFNRRFAPMVQALRGFFVAPRRPLVVTCRVNAGAIPAGHWTQDPAVGGGRIIGEACHFADLLQFLVGAPPVEVHTRAVRAAAGVAEDEAVITFAFADGSIGTVVYTAGGDKAFGKERIEVLGDGKVAVLDDYRSLELVHRGRRRRRREWLRPDKGHRGEWRALAGAAAAGEGAPIPVNELASAHLAVFAAVESLRIGAPVAVDLDAFWEEASRA